MTLKEVTSGNQYLRVLLAEKSDGYCGELNGEDSRCGQKSPTSSWWRGHPMAGPAAKGQPRLAGWHCRPLTAAQLGYVPPHISKRRTLVSVGLKTETAGWPPHHGCFSCAAGREVVLLLRWRGPSQPFSSWWCLGSLRQASLMTPQAGRACVPLCGPEIGVSWRRLVGDGGPGEGSRHPSGVRVVLKNGERGDWASKTAKLHEVQPENQQERLWDKVPRETWRVKIVDIWGRLGRDACDRSLRLVFLFSL